jgi:tRNA threonylcarbamoyladenosine biosynthesis protein TsaB
MTAGSNVLAIDTSGPVTSIGLGRAGKPGFTVFEEGGRKHAEVIDELMLQVRRHLDGERPDAIAVGVGPGPYSGLRVGIAFAIGLGRAWRCPVVGVCSLDAIAWAVADQELHAGDFVVATDARRNEIYWARYDSTAVRIAGPQVMARDLADFDAAVVSDRRVDPALMAARVARYLSEGRAPMATAHQWAPHGSDGSEVTVPVGPLLAPRPLYLRAPDITISARTPAGGSL